MMHYCTQVNTAVQNKQRAIVRLQTSDADDSSLHHIDHMFLSSFLGYWICIDRFKSQVYSADKTILAENVRDSDPAC